MAFQISVYYHKLAPFHTNNIYHEKITPKIKYVCSNGLGTISEISQKINFIRQELSFSFSDFSKYDNIELKKSSIMSKILTTNEEKSCLKNPYLFGNFKTQKSGFGLLYPIHHYNKQKIHSVSIFKNHALSTSYICICTITIFIFANSGV